MTKKGKITHYSITVQLKNGKSISTPWLGTLREARELARKKIGRKHTITAYKFVWRKGSKVAERTKLRSL